MPKDSLSSLINVKLSKIEAIVRELPRVGKRSELKVLADEILRLTETVRKRRKSTCLTWGRCLVECGAGRRNKL